MALIFIWVFIAILGAILLFALERMVHLRRSVSILEDFCQSRSVGASLRFKSTKEINDIATDLDRSGLGPLKRLVEELGKRLHEAEVQGTIEHSRSSKDLITSERFRDSILSGGIVPFVDYQMLHALPGVSTAIGILGTFIGLVIAVNKVDDKGVPDITQLTGGLNTSFITSIFGLLLSITLTIALRRTEGRLNRAINRFTDWMDARLPKRDEEWLLGEILVQQKEATGALKSLKDDMYEALSNALKATVVPELARAFEGQAPAQQAAVASMVDGVVKQLGAHLERAAAQFDAAATQTRQAAEWWSVVSKDLANVTKEQRQLVSELSSAALPVAEAAGKADQLHGKLEGTARALEAGALQLATAGASQKETMEKLVVRLGRVVDDALVALGEMQKVRSSWADSAQKLQEASRDLNSGFSTFVGQFPKAIQDNILLFDKELARVVKGLAAQGGELNNNVRELNTPVSELQKTVAKLAIALRDSMA